MTTYLFKNRFFCTDVFQHVFEEMVRRGYDCVQVIDEDHPDPTGAIEALKGRDVVLVTSDHLETRLGSGYSSKESYSVRECMDLLRPQRAFFSMHDIGIERVEDKLEGFHVLLPGKEWAPLYRDLNVPMTIVGYPKFHLPSRVERTYEAIFFVSSVYVHAASPPARFKEIFAPFFKWNIPFKFPKYRPSLPLVEYVRAQGMTVLDPDIESFDFLHRTRTALSNANSSMAIEGAMAGCNSINLGWSFRPAEVYGGFQVLSVNDPGVGPLRREHLHKEPPAAREDLALDMDLCIEVLTSGKAEKRGKL